MVGLGLAGVTLMCSLVADLDLEHVIAKFELPVPLSGQEFVATEKDDQLDDNYEKRRFSFEARVVKNQLVSVELRDLVTGDVGRASAVGGRASLDTFVESDIDRHDLLCWVN